MSQQIDREDLEDLDEVWLGTDVSVEGEEFVEALNGVDRLARAMEEIQQELSDLNVGLDRDDAIRLIYARNHNMTISQVQGAFDAIDALVDGDPMEAGQRLLATKSDLTIEECGEVLDEMGTLAEKYGSKPDQ